LQGIACQPEWVIGALLRQQNSMPIRYENPIYKYLRPENQPSITLASRRISEINFTNLLILNSF
jgi:hypothetical protein